MRTTDAVDVDGIVDWDDWFCALGRAAGDVESYEKLAEGYFRRRDQAMLGALASGFWREQAPLCAADALICARLAAAGALAGVVAGFMRMSVSGDVAVALPIAAGTCAGVAVGVALTLVRRIVFARRAAALERRLSGVFSLVEPAWRNTFCISALAELGAAYGYHDPAAAARTLARHIDNNKGAARPRLMSDVGLDRARISRIRRVAGVHSKDIVGLPADIESHTREVGLDWERELDSLVGMADVKDEVKRMAARARNGSVSAVGRHHMLFEGPAGCGKTSVARIMCAVLADLGYISEPRIVEVDGDYLKSPHVGATGERVSACCRWAAGSVLFIDEAYLLCDSSDAGTEAIGVLLKEMEDTDDLVVILAGYTDDMERLVASNEGFRSRIRHTLLFNAYTADEQAEICRRFIASAAASLRPDALSALPAVFAVASSMPGHGGARDARTVADRLLERVEAAGTRAVEASDVRAVFASIEAEAAHVRHNWLATSGIDSKIVSASELEGCERTAGLPARAAMDALVGQARAKAQLDAWMARAEMLADDAFCANVMLTGPAGVGKTTFADIICARLFECGRIREPRVVDISGDWLRAPYVGQTGKRAEAAIQWSRGGVLFIDEAYLLIDHGSGGFGAEALGVLVNHIGKHDDFVVVLAGYAPEMAELARMNPGLASRMAATLELKPYTLRELMVILGRMAAASGMTLDKDAYALAASRVRPYMDGVDFGCARAMRRLLDRSIDAHALAWSKTRSLARDCIDAADVARAADELGWYETRAS